MKMNGRRQEHLNRLPEETIRKMADVDSEGYRIGFVNTGKDLSKKSVVNIRYILGFERVVKKAIENFEKMGLKPVIYRAAVSVLTKNNIIRLDTVEQWQISSMNTIIKMIRQSSWIRNTWSVNWKRCRNICTL